jgi:tetratricopeptide (TPR) repeat protein
VRFGHGVDARELPITLCQRVAATRARIFTGFNTSSSVHYAAALPGATRAVPLLTNTWAYPSGSMRLNLEICTGARPFAPYAEHLGVGHALLEASPRNGPLLQQLRAAEDWRLVGFDGLHALFTRASLSDSPAWGSAPDLDALVAILEREHPTPPFALHRAATALTALDAFGEAERLWRRAVDLEPRYHEAWTSLGTLFATRGMRAAQRGDVAAAQFALREAERCLQRALDLRGSYRPARENARTVSLALQHLARRRSPIRRSEDRD